MFEFAENRTVCCNDVIIILRVEASLEASALIRITLQTVQNAEASNLAC